MHGSPFGSPFLRSSLSRLAAGSLLALLALVPFGLDGCSSSSPPPGAMGSGYDAGPNPACALSSAPSCAIGCSTCGNSCVDLMGDPKHCGTCDTTCNQSLSCVQGKCECAPGTNLCANTCVDLSIDPTNCGTCGTTCTGGACNGGHCAFPTVLASNLTSPTGLAVDSSFVYFATTTINRVPIAGGAVSVLGGTAANAMTIDGNNVYWSANGIGIQKIPLGGGTATVLDPKGHGFQIAVDSNNVYWTDAWSDGTEGYKVNQVAIAGGTTTQLADDDGFGMGGLALDGGTIYFGCPSGLFKTTSSGGSKTMLASFIGSTETSTNVSPIVFRGPWVYAGLTMTYNDLPNTAGDYCIAKASVKGAASDFATCLVNGIGTILDVKADDSFVYFTDGANVKKVSTSGGAAITLAGGQSATNLALDGQYVYWSNAGTGPGKGDGAILKIAK